MLLLTFQRHFPTKTVNILLQVSVGRVNESVAFMKAVDKDWKEKYGQEM